MFLTSSYPKDPLTEAGFFMFVVEASSFGFNLFWRVALRQCARLLTGSKRVRFSPCQPLSGSVSGNTRDFDSRVSGSNPGRAAKPMGPSGNGYRLSSGMLRFRIPSSAPRDVGVAGNTGDFHSPVTGSNPVRRSSYRLPDGSGKQNYRYRIGTVAELEIAPGS